MSTRSNLIPGLRRFLTIVAVIAVGAVSTAQSAMITYLANLDGPSESPPNTSPGIGTVQIEIDEAAHTMRVTASFAGLQGLTTAAHIHAATAAPGTGTAGVATTTPTFAGFPTGATSGTYDVTLDMTLTSSYNASFIAAHGGTTATAEAFLLQSIADGTAYFNLHSNSFAGGEIRGFFVADTVPVSPATWGQIKAIYR